MTTRRKFIAAAALATAAAPLRSALAQAPADGAKQADFLFVQSAKRMTYDKKTGKLTLHGVSPVTVFFADRPERIAGNMKTSAFVPFWSMGKDSFLADPPNADISIVEDAKLRQVVAVLQSPVLNGDALTYTVKVLQGDMPAKAADVSVFIDIIGMPLTPVSYAGVARRGYRRAFYYR
jgi:phage baseplate assembly protein gpV